MLIEEIYYKKPWTIAPDASIKDAVKELVSDKCNGLIVVDNDKVVGILALQDIAGACVPQEFKDNVNLADAMFKQGMFTEIVNEIAQKQVREVMRTDFMTVNLQTNILAVMADFLKNDLYIVPVLDGEKLIGVVARGDIRKAIATRMGIDVK